MTRSRFGLLTLCAAVFGVMAFGAVAAHAEVGAKWLILMANGEVLTGSQLPATVGGETDTEGTLLTEILKDKVAISCPEFEVKEAKLSSEGETTEGKVGFKGCTTKINGTLNSSCTPHTTGETAGTVVTEKGKASIKLHELTGGVKDDVALILPTNAEMRFATLIMSETCPIGEKVPIFGEFTVKDCEGKFLTHLVKHLIEEFAPLTELWAISNTAEHKSTIDGSGWVFLTGEHLGLPWAGDPA